MTTAIDWRQYTHLRADSRAIGLVGLFLVVILAALAVRPALIASGTQTVVSESTTSEQAAAGAGWAVAEVIFAGLLLGAILLYRRLPEWMQELASDARSIGFWMIIGAAALSTGAFFLVLGSALGIFAFARTADEFDVWWLINDAVALGLAAVLGAMVGVLLGPIVIGVALLGLTVYDHIFADRETWMFTLGAWTIRNKLPAIFVVPTTIQLDWDRLVDALENDEPMGEVIGFGIGMADLLLPAAFAVAVAQGGGGLPLVGAVAGVLVACFRLSWKMDIGGGAGLPSIATGTLGGWAIASAVVILA